MSVPRLWAMSTVASTPRPLRRPSSGTTRQCGRSRTYARTPATALPTAPPKTSQSTAPSPCTGRRKFLGMSTLIVIRGNSASGKSTVARALQCRFGRGTCVLVSQDTIRREMLRGNEQNRPG
ncbi:AAA family ATPase [Nocardia sp. NBC_00403]|uniref:AAA family ATPase n=1 Tax=Nocardia sp. NBC_00403 TaxID=2975990 RepID=UPI003FA524C1